MRRRQNRGESKQNARPLWNVMGEVGLLVNGGAQMVPINSGFGCGEILNPVTCFG
jgi:hypothetical protein